MKTILTTSLALLAALGLSACGGSTVSYECICDVDYGDGSYAESYDTTMCDAEDADTFDVELEAASECISVNDAYDCSCSCETFLEAC
jgi:hypothetical protein